MRHLPPAPAAASVVSLLLLAAAGCQNAGHDRVLGIEATSEVQGVAYFDADRSRTLDSSDTRMAGLRVYLAAAGTSDTVARSTSDATGLLRFAGVSVGRYDVLVDQASAGDTVVVVRIDTSQVALAPDDTIPVSIGLSYPLATVAEARTAPAGKKVFVEGVALTGTNVFGDTTANMVAGSGALRLVRVFSGFFSVGDSIRARGTVSSRDGEPVLRDVTVFPIGIGTLPAVDSLSTGVAANAAGATRDAGLARVGATLQDTLTVGSDLAVDVEDGSGALRVLLDGDVTAFQPPQRSTLWPYLVSPARIVVTGVLVPSAVAGTWYLKPRSNLDLKVFVDVSSTVQVRQRPVGTRVFVDGVVLDAPNTFGDSTMNLADAAGAIRVVRTLQGGIATADSIRVAATVTTQDGLPVLSNATIFRLGQGAAPIARSLSADSAASAGGGALDAALVRIKGTVQSTSPGPGGDLRAVVKDVSGVVTVVLDGDIAGFNRPAWIVGAPVDVRGLLVPEPGVWVVKPRTPSDVSQP